MSQLHAWKSVPCSVSLAILLSSLQTENNNDLSWWKPNLIQTKTRFTLTATLTVKRSNQDICYNLLSNVHLSFKSQ